MIYFVRPVGLSGPIKIGLASDANKRLKTLEASSPLRLEIIATLEGGKEVECRLHERFLGQQSHYEWFHWSASLQETVDQINAGIFDIEGLPQAKGTAPTQRGRPSSWLPERRHWLTPIEIEA